MEFKEDPKFSVIVPVYNVPDGTLKRCLLSIAEQDYSNIEVVVVANGGDKKAFDDATEYWNLISGKSKQTWKIFFREEKGACEARNFGFEKSSGEIVAFVNSDYILKIGCISMWVDALLAHPECGFAYGAYEYLSSKRDIYGSKPFDPYLLDVANYIDCGFPLWRKHFVPWDPEVKSLQDWDFWIRVVKNGIKGHFLGRDISFLAEYPRAKGLSEDSANNWIERVRFVKNKNGIPIRDICVTSIGAPNHGVEIAKMIGADYRDDTLFKPHEYKLGYLIGWYMKPGEQHNGHSSIITMFRNAKKVVHFVGADIYWLRMFSVKQIREFAGALKLATDYILCENMAAQQELASFGIEAEIVPIPPYSSFEVEPMPEEFSVGILLTDKSDFDKYLKDHTLSIVKAMPDIKFYGYGDADLGDFKSRNFVHKGYLKRDEWEKFVKERSAYLRLVRHDTTPMASAEFMLAGKPVISNIENECTNYIDTSGELLFDKWDKFAPGFNAIRWPDTKKKIVQTIRSVSKELLTSEFREKVHKETAERFDKNKYINALNKMMKKADLEVINS